MYYSGSELPKHIMDTAELSTLFILLPNFGDFFHHAQSTLDERLG